MRELPAELYRAAQVRELDRIAIEEHGIPGYTLMQRAGAAAFDWLRQDWPSCRAVGPLSRNERGWIRLSARRSFGGTCRYDESCIVR